MIDMPSEPDHNVPAAPQGFIHYVTPTPQGFIQYLDSSVPLPESSPSRIMRNKTARRQKRASSSHDREEHREFLEVAVAMSLFAERSKAIELLRIEPKILPPQSLKVRSASMPQFELKHQRSLLRPSQTVDAMANGSGAPRSLSPTWQRPPTTGVTANTTTQNSSSAPNAESGGSAATSPNLAPAAASTTSTSPGPNLSVPVGARINVSPPLVPPLQTQHFVSIANTAAAATAAALAAWKPAAAANTTSTTSSSSNTTNTTATSQADAEDSKLLEYLSHGFNTRAESIQVAQFRTQQSGTSPSSSSSSAAAMVATTSSTTSPTAAILLASGSSSSPSASATLPAASGFTAAASLASSIGATAPTSGSLSASNSSESLAATLTGTIGSEPEEFVDTAHLDLWERVGAGSFLSSSTNSSTAMPVNASSGGGGGSSSSINNGVASAVTTTGAMSLADANGTTLDAASNVSWNAPKISSGRPRSRSGDDAEHLAPPAVVSHSIDDELLPAPRAFRSQALVERKARNAAQLAADSREYLLSCWKLPGFRWSDLDFGGTSFICGVFHLSHEFTVSSRIRTLSEPTPMSAEALINSARQYVYNITESAALHALERERTMPLENHVTWVACGYNSICMVSDSGELWMAAPTRLAGPVCLGQATPVQSWPGFVLMPDLLV